MSWISLPQSHIFAYGRNLLLYVYLSLVGVSFGARWGRQCLPFRTVHPPTAVESLGRRRVSLKALGPVL